ncbi:MAG TPA: serine/threonine-protein kinase, partial [Gemmatimonadales bacterium]
MSAEFDRLAQALADRYRLERELGAGGMATVYLAHDLRHQRQVALKVLKPELAAVIGGERFLHEIRTTANLQHPHILPLFDSGTVEGTVFYVMPYVEGESLRDRLAREKQLPIPDAVRIAREVAAALDYAHRHGVIHRDIKPENILLPDGQALVADFGIALAASSAGGSRMTESGMSLGTPRYMSPEQAMGEHDITPRSDVYALGCVLYEMLTGDPPFTGSTAQAIIAQIITEDPRTPSVRRPTTPPEVEEAVLTALARLPADRFPSAAAFSTALADGAVSTGARRAATLRPSARPPVLFGLAFLAVSALAAIGWLRPAGRAGDQRVTAAVLPLELRTPTNVPLNESGPPVSLGPDGGFLIYVGADPDSGAATALWRRPLDRLEATPIPGTRGALAPEVHPDGTSMSFSRRRADGRTNERMELPIEGGLPTPAPPVRRLRDGRRLLRADSAFRLVDAQAEIPPNDRFWERDHRALHNLDVSPDGLWLAQTQKFGGVDSVVLRTLEPRTTHRLAAGVSPRFLAEDVLVFRAPDGTLQVGRLRPDRSGFVSAPLPLVSNVSLAGSGEAIFDVAADGTLVYAPGAAAGQGRLVWVDAAGHETPFPGAEPQVYGGVTLSPDGRLAAVTVGAL